jgi:hypothetical protein
MLGQKEKQFTAQVVSLTGLGEGEHRRGAEGSWAEYQTALELQQLVEPKASSERSAPCACIFLFNPLLHATLYHWALACKGLFQHAVLISDTLLFLFPTRFVSKLDKNVNI